MCKDKLHVIQTSGAREHFCQVSFEKRLNKLIGAVFKMEDLILPIVIVLLTVFTECIYLKDINNNGLGMNKIQHIQLLGF